MYDAIKTVRGFDVVELNDDKPFDKDGFPNIERCLVTNVSKKYAQTIVFVLQISKACSFEYVSR